MIPKITTKKNVPLRICIQARVSSEKNFIKDIYPRKSGPRYHLRYFINLLPFRIKKTPKRGKTTKKARAIPVVSPKTLIKTKIKIEKDIAMRPHFN
jgi:hypothetical protein